MAVDDYERVEVSTRAAWRRWLKGNHERSPGAWLVSWKQATGRPSVAYEESVEEALCFGWVDSMQKTVDDERSRLLFTPRKARSKWSRPNKERVERLLAAGLMAPAGIAAVERAKENGGWTALDDVENLVVPDDLAAALAKRKGARETWEGFPRSVKRGLLAWVVDAKRPETRAKRVDEIAREAAAGRRAGQWGRA